MKKIMLFALGALCCSSLSAQTVLRPHFTDSSKKIVMPQEASVFPEIHDGLIALTKYPAMLFVNLKGDYVFGTDFPFTRGNDYIHSPYFSGGAMMGRRTKEDGYSAVPFILYPDGRYRDFPTGTKNASGMSNDVSQASSFVDGVALVQRGSMYTATQSFIDKNGRDIFPALKSKVTTTMGDMKVYPVRDGRRKFYHAELKKYGFADEKGIVMIKPQFDKAENFSEGLAAVMVKEGYNEKWGFIDKTGKLVIAATYRLKPGRFSEGLAPVRIGESESSCEMAYIDKTGKRMIENTPWSLNEFHNGYAWVGTGCDKLFVWDREFKEVRNVTADFYHGGNGFGVCSFRMTSEGVTDPSWGIDFPNDMQSLNQRGVADGDIFAPDGKVIYTCVDASDRRVNLHYPTEGGLMFCQVRMEGEAARLKEDSVYLSCFINQKGEIVYYFVEGVEGYEGPKPVLVK